MMLPSAAAIAAPAGPPRFGLVPISTLTRLTVPNAANASSARANSSRAIRPPAGAATGAVSTTGGAGNSTVVFVLRAIGSHLRHVRNYQRALAQFVAEVVPNGADDLFFHARLVGAQRPAHSSKPAGQFLLRAAHVRRGAIAAD